MLKKFEICQFLSYLLFLFHTSLLFHEIFILLSQLSFTVILKIHKGVCQMKKIITVILSLSFLFIFSANSTTKAEETSDYGSSGALAKSEYTLLEMLTYAIQDEYVARAEYEKIMEVYGVQKPFSNIILSEENHIAMLVPLFDRYGFELPADTAYDHVVVPGSLLEAYKIGVQAEIYNIAMYDSFLKQDLPTDVRSVFIKLRDASYNHLNAFENKVAQAESTTSGNGGNGWRGGR